LSSVPVRFLNLSQTEAELFAIADNKLGEISDWDETMLKDILSVLPENDLDDIGFSLDELEEIITDSDNEFDVGEFEEYRPNLYERFLVPPFSFIDCDNGDWKKRKKYWQQYFQSGEGRSEGLLGSNSLISQYNNGTSIFDPVLCEVLYSWFSSENCTILDPFSGGSVRGIMASFLNRNYLGIDIRKEQIEENIRQYEKNNLDQNIQWIHGNSENIDQLVDQKADLIFTCPPYFDLEVYSDLEDDISNKSYNDFLSSYKTIIKKSCQLLEEDRFAIFTIGDVRDQKGMYRNLVSKTIEYFLDAGLNLYNEIILKTALTTVPQRCARPFKATRKVGKTHQNILVFVKGDPKKATEFCGKVDVLEIEDEV
jgi:DNA modification methylase